MLDVSDIAPDFTLPSSGGADVTLSSGRPAATVLFFYPRDDTLGCTKESIGFSELSQDFSGIGALVYGISKDSVASHNKFIAKHTLAVRLLSDEHGQVCETYGVWNEKNMYGKTFMGIERTTFLIDGRGRIASLWSKVKVPGHVEDVLAAARAL
jgi:peroxiredoxin Q/BCP